MSKEKKMPKEYAITVSLMMFFAIAILVGGIRLYLVTKDVELVDLDSIGVVEQDTNIDLSSYNLRIATSIRETYGVDIYYGEVAGLDSVNAVAVTDDTAVFNMLRNVNKVLAVYPKNLIKEIESQGYEFSIYLVDHFTTNAEAIANRNSVGQMKIYISDTMDFERALHHEYYHILDYYIKLEYDESLQYMDWENYNPANFEYEQDVNNITSKYVYKGDAGAFFVTAYAKYSEKEDRAETFAEMVTASKDEIFFNEDGPIKGKINIIKKVLYNTFETIRQENGELAWE